MEVTVEHLGAVQFQIKTRGHSIVGDQPADSGGLDEGMTPPELLLLRSARAPAFTPPSICARISWPRKARAYALPAKK
jgi:hypothetical protein